MTKMIILRTRKHPTTSRNEYQLDEYKNTKEVAVDFTNLFLDKVGSIDEARNYILANIKIYEKIGSKLLEFTPMEIYELVKQAETEARSMLDNIFKNKREDK